MSEEIIKQVISRKPRKILNKKESYALYEAGILGNRALNWKTWEDYKKVAGKVVFVLGGRVSLDLK